MFISTINRIKSNSIFKENKPVLKGNDWNKQWVLKRQFTMLYYFSYETRVIENKRFK
jgi:hypothetical protein